MQRALMCSWLSFVIGLAGCSSGAIDGSAGSGQGLSATDETAATELSGGTGACWRVAGARPPLGPSDITTVGSGPFDMVSTAFVGTSDEITTVYEDYSDDYLSSGRLSAATSVDCGRTFSTPKPIALGTPANYQTTPSAVRVGWRQYLYFASADGLGDPATIYRTELRAGAFGEPQVVPPISGVGSLLSWPRFIEGPFGVAVASRTTPDKLPNFAMSFDGLAFAPPSTVNPTRSAMPRTAFSRSGAAVFTYQTVSDDLSRFWAWWRTSTDGKSWSDPRLVTTASENAQDTAPFLRSDGDIDLYYIYSSIEPTDTFKLYRRSLTWCGHLGPEELVTSVGSPNKPNLKRLPGGKVLLMYADITQVDPDGYPLEQIFKVAVLAGDAPRL